jgi:hypothetical protein
VGVNVDGDQVFVVHESFLMVAGSRVNT